MRVKIPPPHTTTASARRGVHPLTEDRSLFDGPRATYGRFRVLHQIGAGSVGPVFRGEDGETRQRVVIKVIRVGLTPEKVAAVAEALAALRANWPAHPALAPLVDTGVVDVEPYVVTPWVDGDSLDVALRDYGPAHLSDALPRLRMLAGALDAAADGGTSHGSLHLRDIIVAVEHTVLTGLGVAPILERVGVRPPVRRPYCAPEVAGGGGTSPQADQYALAAIAHEWLSGRRLTGVGVTGFQVPAASVEGAEALKAVFARALDEDPGGRYPSAIAFVEALGDLAGHAAPRASRGRRREAAAEAPRLAFDALDDFAEDETPAAAGPLTSPADDAGEGEAGAGVLAPDFVAEARLQPDADSEPGVAGWDDDGQDGDDEGEADLPLAVDAAGPDGLDGHGDGEAPPVEVPAPPADEAVRPGWTATALVLVLMTAAALAGGWALLRWGTPAARPGETVATGVRTAAIADADVPRAADAVPSPEPRPVPLPAAETPVPTPSVTADAPAAAAPAPRPRAEAAPPARRDSAASPAGARPTAPPNAAAPSARPSAVRTAGRLLVRSSPSGAEVFLNGERRGVTPLTVRDLPLQTYAVEVRHAGFASSERRVVLDASRPARSLDVTLARSGRAAAAPRPPAAATGPGSLLLESRPAGARVFVDGQARGVTPLTLAEVPSGTHTVRFERAGYQTISTTVRVEPRTRARAAVSLTVERPR